MRVNYGSCVIFYHISYICHFSLDARPCGTNVFYCASLKAANFLPVLAFRTSYRILAIVGKCCPFTCTAIFHLAESFSKDTIHLISMVHHIFPSVCSQTQACAHSPLAPCPAFILVVVLISSQRPIRAKGGEGS